MKYTQLAQRLYNQPWAILPDKLDAIDFVLQLRLAGDKLSDEEVAEAMGAAPKPIEPPHRSVAVLPLFGVISQHAGVMQRTSGGTSTEEFTKQFQRAVTDPHIGSIVIHTHSPGGSVYGVRELADVIHAARGQKKITTVASSMMASAAYWIGTAADEVVVTPGGDVGSIGVLAMHTDISQAEEAAGIKTTLIATPPRKVWGNPYEPLGEEARADVEQSVAESYEDFVAAVARNRGVAKAKVKSGYGGGGMVGAKQAAELGMVDRVATLDDVLRREVKRISRWSRNNNALRLAEAG